MKPTETEIQANGEEKRRLPRVNLSHEQFRLGPNGKLFWVADLSASGFGVRITNPEDLILFTMGRRLEGILNLHGDKQRVSGQVQHVSRGSVGIQFSELEDTVKKAISGFLDPSHLSRGLKRMPGAVDESLAWWSGASGTEIMVWRPEASGEFERALLLLWGGYVEWNKAGEISTGRWSHALEEPEMRGAIRLETLTFHPDQGGGSLPQMAVAKVFLLSSNLPEALVQRLTQSL